MKIQKAPYISRRMLLSMKPGNTRTWQLPDYYKVASARTQIYALARLRKGRWTYRTDKSDLTITITRHE